MIDTTHNNHFTISEIPARQAVQLVTVNTQPHFALDVVQKVSLLKSFEEGVGLVQKHVTEQKGPVIVSFINAHAYNLCCSNKHFHQALLGSDIILRDGTGMKILYNSLAKDPGINFCGTDFIPFMLQTMPEKTVALIGTEDPYLSQAAQHLRNNGFKVVLAQNGFLAPADYVTFVQETKPEIIIMGMGMPKQEQVAYLLKQTIKHTCVIINGGAIIDYMGKKVSRAPKWVRDYGMEWVYRFMLEPKRMYKRYVIGNYLFMRRVQRLKKAL